MVSQEGRGFSLQLSGAAEITFEIYHEGTCEAIQWYL